MNPYTGSLYKVGDKVVGRAEFGCNEGVIVDIYDKNSRLVRFNIDFTDRKDPNLIIHACNLTTRLFDSYEAWHKNESLAVQPTAALLPQELFNEPVPTQVLPASIEPPKSKKRKHSSKKPVPKVQDPPSSGADAAQLAVADVDNEPKVAPSKPDKKKSKKSTEKKNRKGSNYKFRSAVESEAAKKQREKKAGLVGKDHGVSDGDDDDNGDESISSDDDTIISGWDENDEEQSSLKHG